MAGRTRNWLIIWVSAIFANLSRPLREKITVDKGVQNSEEERGKRMMDINNLRKSAESARKNLPRPRL